jgi:hypothetical protein
MALWLCLRFDALPLEALLTPQSLHSDMALVVISQRQVLTCNEFAQLAGVMAGAKYQHSTNIARTPKKSFLGALPRGRKYPATTITELGLRDFTTSAAMAG